MGIEGLLKNLKKCMQQKNLEQYRGQRAAVDTYAWLHKIIKGPNGTGKEIVTGKDPKKYINDCIKRAEKIIKAGIDLTLVFDGGVLPRKQKQQQIRRKRRQENLQKGKQLIQNGNIQQGFKKMVDSIDVSPDIAYMLIEQLKNRGIKFIIAPYEADAQLAYLNRVGIVDIIITEDSDLLAFGAKKILYKLDFSTLNGEQISLESIPHEPSTGFLWFSHCMFLSTCIMAGCDYLEQIKGVGMKYAQKTIGKTHTIKKALSELALGKQIPENYQDNFFKAMLTFRFQRVYCPVRKCCVSVNQMETKKWKNIKNIQKCNFWYEQIFDLQTLQYALTLSTDQNNEDWQFLGKKLSTQLIIQIAEGQINPITFTKYDENCLEKLKYENQGLLLVNKKNSSIQSKQTNNNLLKYWKPTSKKNSLEYKSIQQKTSFQQEYRVYNYQQKKVKNYFSITQINGNKNKPLKIDNGSDHSQQQISGNQSGELISSDESKSNQALSVCSIKSKNTIKSDQVQNYFRNKLQEISQTMFGKIFSDQYLKSPFSY